MSNYLLTILYCIYLPSQGRPKLHPSHFLSLQAENADIPLVVIKISTEQDLSHPSLTSYFAPYALLCFHYRLLNGHLTSSNGEVR